MCRGRGRRLGDVCCSPQRMAFPEGTSLETDYVGTVPLKTNSSPQSCGAAPPQPLSPVEDPEEQPPQSGGGRGKGPPGWTCGWTPSWVILGGRRPWAHNRSLAGGDGGGREGLCRCLTAPGRLPELSALALGWGGGDSWAQPGTALFRQGHLPCWPGLLSPGCSGFLCTTVCRARAAPAGVSWAARGASGPAEGLPVLL